MALNKILMAGVALPLLTFTLSAGNGFTQPLRPAVSAPLSGNVILVQDSGVVLDENGQPVEDQKRKKHKKSQSSMEQPAADQGQQTDEGQQSQKERKKKRDQAQQQEDVAQPEAASVDNGQTVTDEQPVEKKKDKKKKQQQAVEEQQQDPAAELQAPVDNGQAVTDEQPVEKKKDKKEKQQQAVDQQQDPAVDPAADPSTDLTQPDANNQAAEDELLRKKKEKKKQQQADEQQPDNSAITDVPADANAADEGQTNKKKRKKDQVQSVVDEPLAADVKQEIQVKEKIAENPAKSTEVIELPVKNGNAVLDSEKDVRSLGDDALIAKRKKQREKVQIKVPQSDLDAQVNIKVKYPDLKIEPVLDMRGEKLKIRPDFEDTVGRRVGKGDDVRIIFNIDNRIVIRNDQDDRLWRGDSRVRYEQLDNGRIREIVVKPDGTRVITIRNRFGEIIRRSRIEADNREIIIFFSPDLDRGREQLYLRDPGFDLPPMRLGIPLDDYIIDTSSDPDRDYRKFLAKPPVERVERVYSMDEVKYSARIRDKVRRIDLDTITFETGSAEISMDQASSLRQVASAIRKLLANDPGETFLIEGHTDAVGSDESNLILSDLRAESVANVLSDLFDIPAENLATQGYGERFLKVDTDGAERLNRRVTIRRVTPLVRPVAEAE